MTKNSSTTQFVWGVSFFMALFVNFPIIFLQLPRLQKSHIAQLDIVIQIVVCLIYAVLFIQLVYLNSKRKTPRIRYIFEVLLLLIIFVFVLSTCPAPLSRNRIKVEIFIIVNKLFWSHIS